ncbi:MAG: trypsin-like peptidase domain-containing protein [Pirellulaceae bacterium]
MSRWVGAFSFPDQLELLMPAQQYYGYQPPRKNSNTAIFIGIGIVAFLFLLAAIGGAAAWYFLFRMPTDQVALDSDFKDQRDEVEQPNEDSAKKKESKKENTYPKSKPILSTGDVPTTPKTTPKSSSPKTSPGNIFSSNSSSAGQGSKSSGKGLADLPDEYRRGGKLNVDDGNSARYNLEPNVEYGINFWIDLLPRNGTKSSTKGRTVYKISQDDPLALLSAHKGRLEIDLKPQGGSSGTGFAIHPDGVIMTCAHVVEGADRVFVKINNQNVPATVIAYDAANDLALLKVAQTFSQIIPMSDSIPDLGTSCRAIGFPMASEFGTNVKMSTGTINGVDEAFGERRLLIDATVNPGNSGGPVVGEEGQLYGVAAAILTAEKTQDVSFCVPIDTVQEMLRRSRVPVDVSKAGRGMADSRSVKTFKDAVDCTYLILVPDETDKLKASDLYVLEFKCKSTTTQGEAAPPPATETSGKMVVDRMGKVLFTEASASLPFFVGRASTIGFDRYPMIGTSRWQAIETQVITMSVPKIRQDSGFDPLGNMFAPRFGGFSGPSPQFGGGTVDNETVAMIAAKVHQYKANKTAGSFEKVLDLVCIDQELQPKLMVRCQGSVAFDKTTGFAKKSSMTGEYQSMLGQSQKAGQITVNYGYMTPQEVAVAEAEEKERARKAQEAELAAQQEQKRRMEKEAEEKRQRIEAAVRMKDQNVKNSLDQFDPDK